MKSFTRPILETRTSRGGLDEINPNDVVYGEYSDDGGKQFGPYIDLVYLDGEILRTYSGSIAPSDPVLQELKILLRDDRKFYLVPIKEVGMGFAFKRTDITDIKVSSIISGNSNHEASCIWEVTFEDHTTRTLETNYQSYFSYGNTSRPASMINLHILNRAFPKSSK